MKRHSAGLLVLSFLLVVFSAGTGHAENYARVCVSTVDADSKEAPLGEGSSPGPGTKVLVHLDANAACAALVVPLLENGKQLANGWRPEIVELAPWEAKALPDANRNWDWNKDAEPFEIWIFFFKRDAPSLGTFRILVAAMQNPTLPEKTIGQQTAKLFETLGSRMSGTLDIIKGPKADATLVGGRLRSVDFPWRDFAHKVGLNAAFEGALVVRHGR